MLKKAKELVFEQPKNIRFAMHTIVHPFDGFYEMKHSGKGRFSIVFMNIVLFWISFSFLKQYVGFPFLSRDINTMNSLIDFCVILLAFTLLCTANWSVSALLEGEGRFKDIVMAGGYSMTPLNLLFIPATVFSRFLAEQEGTFYLIFIYAGVVWFLFLLFVGILTVHNYTMGKTAFTVLLTVLAAFVILFLGLLFITVYRQIAGVIQSVYVELSYRT